EVAILRRYERDRVLLIVHKLCGRQVTRAAELSWIDESRRTSFYRLGGDDLFHLWPTFAASDFDTECKQFEIRVEESGAIDGGQPGNRIDDVPEFFAP